MIDKDLLFELLDEYTENLCKTVNNKHYSLVTGNQLTKIIEEYMKRAGVERRKA